MGSPEVIVPLQPLSFARFQMLLVLEPGIVMQHIKLALSVSAKWMFSLLLCLERQRFPPLTLCLLVEKVMRDLLV